MSVPLASHCGWNPVRLPDGRPGPPVDMLGSTIPFARTVTERRGRGDSRPSIAERYGSREDYLDQVRRAASILVDERLLLREDIDVVVHTAGRTWDVFAR